VSSNPFEDATAWETSAGGPMLAVGDHVVTIVQADDSTAGTKNPQIELRFEAAGGGGSIRAWETYHDEFLARVVALFDSAGVDRPKPGEFDPADRCRIKQQVLDRLVGQTVGIVVGEEDDNRPDHYGEKRRRVQGYLKPEEIDPTASVQPAGNGQQFGPKVPF
jgi:hypothetical protein